VLWTYRFIRVICENGSLREPNRGDTRGRFGELVSKGIWRVLAGPVSMLRIGIYGGTGSPRVSGNGR